MRRPPKLESGRPRIPEIPTSPSLLAAFGTQAGSVVGDVLKVLFRVNEMLEDVDMKEINRSVVASAAGGGAAGRRPGAAGGPRRRCRR